MPSWSLSVEALCYLFFIVAALIMLGLALVLYSHIADQIGRGLIGFFVGYHLWRWRGFRIPPLLLTPVIVLAPLATDIGPIQYHVILLFTLWPALVRVALALPCPAILKWLGDRSYSIYLVHFPLYMAVHIALGGRPPAWPLTTMIACAAIILALADLSYRRLELPAKRFLTERLPGFRIARARPGTM